MTKLPKLAKLTAWVGEALALTRSPFEFEVVFVEQGGLRAEAQAVVIGWRWRVMSQWHMVHAVLHSLGLSDVGADSAVNMSLEQRLTLQALF